MKFAKLKFERVLLLYRYFIVITLLFDARPDQWRGSVKFIDIVATIIDTCNTDWRQLSETFLADIFNRQENRSTATLLIANLFEIAKKYYVRINVACGRTIQKYAGKNYWVLGWDVRWQTKYTTVQFSLYKNLLIVRFPGRWWYTR